MKALLPGLAVLLSCQGIMKNLEDNSRQISRGTPTVSPGGMVNSAGKNIQDNARQAGDSLDFSLKNNIISRMKPGYNADADKYRKMSPENEHYLGRAVTANLLAENDVRYRSADYQQAAQVDPKEYRLKALTEYVGSVGYVVAVTAMLNALTGSEGGVKDGDRPDPLGGYHFIVVESDGINAYASPGGFVMVTTGLLKQLGTEDELAGVLAHEVQHIRRGHGLAMIADSRKTSVFGEGLAKEVAGNIGANAKQAGDSLKSTGMNVGNLAEQLELLGGCIGDITNGLKSGYSQEYELEADRLGMITASRAGYDPNGLVSFLNQMKKLGKGGKGGWLSTHASPEERVKKLQPVLATLPKAKPAPPIRAQRLADAKAALQ